MRRQLPLATFALSAAFASASLAQDPCSVSRLAAGEAVSLAVRGDGTLWCWGDPALAGDPGALGADPIRWVSSLSSVVGVAAGRHVLAATSDGAAWAWGRNDRGQCGVAPSARVPAPVALGLPGVVAGLATGDAHSLALLTDGSAWSWGANEDFQLGRSGAGSETPELVAGVAAAAAVAAGGDHSLALLGDGTLLAWGAGSAFQLGDGRGQGSAAPVAVLGLTEVTGLSAGLTHSLAVTADGRVWSWGTSTHGQLGNVPAGASSAAPRELTGLPPIARVAAGRRSSFALATDGTLWAWGDNSRGAFGALAPMLSESPRQVGGILDAIDLAAGAEHVLIRRADGSLAAWGANGLGELGVEPDSRRSSPATLPGGFVATAVAAGRQDQSHAIRPDGTLSTWGDGSQGELGDGTSPPGRLAPGAVGGLVDVTSVDSGTGHVVAVQLDGTVKAWGRNVSGQLGTGDRVASSLPLSVGGLTEALEVACGSDHSLALRADGTAWSWGANWFGMLGNGTTADSSTPGPVAGVLDATAVAAGLVHSLALLADGTVVAWGQAADGRLGTPSRGAVLTPETVTGLSGITQVACGLEHSLALDDGGTVHAWGLNGSGQAGAAGVAVVESPVPVSIPDPVRQVAAGGAFSIAVTTWSEAWVWGESGLDLGTGLPGHVPQRIPSVAGVAVASAGGSHALLLLEDGSVMSWGANDRGQLGLGTGSWTADPQDPGFRGPARDLGPVLRVVKDAAPGDVRLSWRLSHAAATVRLFRDTDVAFSAPVTVADTAAFELPDAPPGAPLWAFRVAAIDCGGNLGP